MHSVGLVLHIVGVFLLGGGTIAGLFIERLAWQQIRSGLGWPDLTVIPLLNRYPIVIQAGAGLMLVSGLLMLSAVNWGYWGQWWFTTKLILYVVVVATGAVLGKPLGDQMTGLLSGALPYDADQLTSLKRRVLLVHLIQNGLLLALVVVSVYKFQ